MSEQQWISVQDSNPPTGCVVFTCKGRDVGIGVFTGQFWRNLSGHSMLPEYWAMIEFPQPKGAK